MALRPIWVGMARCAVRLRARSFFRAHALPPGIELLRAGTRGPRIPARLWSAVPGLPVGTRTGERPALRGGWIHLDSLGFTWSAAHKAARAAGASPVRDEMNVPVVITDLRRSDSTQASSVVNVPSGAGQASWRAAALSERCSFVKSATRSPVGGSYGCRASSKWAKAKPGVLGDPWSHRSKDGGTSASSGR